MCVCVNLCLCVCVTPQKQKTLLETQREAGEGLKGLQQQLDLGLQESSQLKAKLAKTESDLRTTLEE